MNVFKYVVLSVVFSLLCLTGCTGFEMVPQATSGSAPSGFSIKGTVLSLSSSASSMQATSKMVQKSSISTLSAPSRTTLGGLKVQLFAMNSKGQPIGAPLAQAQTDALGVFSFDISKELSSKQIEYIVIASTPDLSFVLEGAVTSTNFEVSEASSVAVKAVRSASQSTGYSVANITPQRLVDMLNAAESVIAQNSITTVSDAYTLVTTTSAFKSALSNGFNTNMWSVDISGLPPDVVETIVKKNGTLTTDLSFSPGDVINIKTVAIDPNGRPLQYKYLLINNCALNSTLLDWAATDNVTYTIKESDITDCTSVVVGVKNDDGTDYDSSFLGDAQRTVSLKVRDNRQPAVMTSVAIKKNDVVYTGNEFSVGDKITLNAAAIDPNGLQLQYRFMLYQGGSYKADVQAWSSSSEASYTFTDSDLTNATSIVVGVKNNDGIDLNQISGDDSKTVSLKMVDPRTPAKIATVTVYKNDVEYSGADFKVGDKIKIEVAASDDNSLPLEYKFVLYRNNTSAVILREFSSSNILSYVITSAEVTSGVSIGIGVKNDDGIDWDSSFFGDVQKGISLNIAASAANPYFEGVSYAAISNTNGHVVAGNSFQTPGATAKDPNDLPLEYAYYLENCSGTKKLIQNWSNSASIHYTFVAEDLDTCTTIIEAVRNNDGVNALSAELGDISFSNTIDITP